MAEFGTSRRYLDVAAGVGARLGCGCPIWQIFVGNTPNSTWNTTLLSESDTAVVSDLAK